MKKKICLDIGHGKDTYPPSKGIGDFAEWDFNNAVGRYTIAELERQGFEIYLSQPLDSDCVLLNTRTKHINKEKCDMVVSIHANYNRDYRCEGHWAFYWHSAEDSKRLALMWQKHANQILPNKDMGITPCKPGTWTDFAICRDTNMTAILLEHAFYSNPKELDLLRSDDFRRKCAEVISRTVCEYFGVPYKEKDGVPRWQQEAFKNMIEIGVINRPDYWAKKLNEPVTTGELFGILNKLMGGN